MRKISLPKYVAWNNPRKAQQILKKYRVPKAKNHRDLKRKLHYVIVRYKDQALADVMSIHPDRELFSYSGFLNSAQADNNETKSGACGCGGSVTGVCILFFLVGTTGHNYQTKKKEREE